MYSSTGTQGPNCRRTDFAGKGDEEGRYLGTITMGGGIQWLEPFKEG